MGKSIRSKRNKRLREIRREIVEKEPLFQKKEDAKLAALQLALNAPKLPIKGTDSTASASTSALETSQIHGNDMDVEMGDDYMKALKPVGGIGKKLKNKFKVGKGKKGKGKSKRKYK